VGSALVFGKGISSGDEPALWQENLTSVIKRWIESGQPDECEIRKACGRTQHVVIISHGRSAELWWNQNRDKLQRLDNLTVLRLPTAGTQALVAFARRTLQLPCTIQEGLVWITAWTRAVQIEPFALLRAAGDKPANG
jgi:uncharacterized protein YaeQ